jgi:ELWxxDGT repeat protein
MRTWPVRLFCGVSLLCAGSATAQPAHLVADLDTSTATGSSWVSTALTPFQGALYFGAASIGGVGQLWTSNGTPESTRKLEDFSSPLGFYPYALTPLEGRLVFFVGGSLWSADANAESLTLLHEFPLVVQAWAATPSALFFQADDGVHGYELWKSDGTSSGTGIVADLEPGSAGSFPYGLTARGATLFFFTWGQTGPPSLWRSDGSPFGTERVTELPPGTGADSFQVGAVAAGDLVFFIASVFDELTHPYQLWRSDGTEAGTFSVGDFGFDSPSVCPGPCFPYGPSGLAVLGDRVVFIANDGTHGREIWVSDGTRAGTSMLRDTKPGAEAGLTFYTLAAGPYVYFSATDSAHGTELWRTDGTPAGTELVADLVAGTGSSDAYPEAAIEGRLVFTTRFAGLEVWESDGSSAGTRRLASLDAQNVGLFAGLSDELLFVTGDGGGSNLWRSDRTEPGTLRIEEFETGAGSFPSILHPFGGRVAFSLSDSDSPSLWASDGTGAGTVPLREMLTAGGGFTTRQSAALGGELFFAATEPEHGMELWATDGSPEGTRLIRDIVPGGPDSHPFAMTPALGQLFFAAWNGARLALFSTDGTGAGTHEVGQVSPHTEGGALLSAGGFLYLIAGDADHGGELWRTDGTDAGTVLVKDINPGPDSSAVSTLAALNGGAVFGAWDGGSWGLWKSDGTAAGTLRIREFPSWLGGDLTAAGGLVYFTSGVYSDELWVSDGTESGTRRLSTVRPTMLTAVGARLFFIGEDGVHGPELWRTDGSEPGTALVRDVRPGVTGSLEPWNFGAMAAAGDRLFFAADDGEHGIELWASDGTEAGTVMLQDIAPGRASSRPYGLVRAGETVFFSANDGATGTELWAVPAGARLSSPRALEPAGRPQTPTRTLPRRP